MYKVNDEYFANLYDASKYVMKLAAEGKTLTVRKTQPGEALLARLRGR